MVASSSASGSRPASPSTRCGAACDVEPEVSGNEITLKTDHPQTTLYRLTGWAERQGVELEGLEVTRPSLDDVFLELTAEARES